MLSGDDDTESIQPLPMAAVLSFSVALTMGLAWGAGSNIGAEISIVSSVSVNGQQSTYSPDLAIDGIFSNDMRAAATPRSCFHSTLGNASLSPALILDLGASYALAAVVLWPRTDCCMNPRNLYWQMCVGDALTALNCSICQLPLDVSPSPTAPALGVGPAIAPYNTTVSCSGNGRYVNLSRPYRIADGFADNFLGICEIKLFAVASATATGTQSVTPSRTQSRTQTSSSTGSCNPSQTRTPSITKTISRSQAQTPSQSGTGSSSPSLTRTSSQPLTWTASQTSSRSPNQFRLVGTTPGDLFGGAVSLSSDGLTLAVGAVGYSSSLGAVFVYACVFGGTCGGAPVTTITGAAASGAGASFGVAVAVNNNGTLLAVGAPYANVALGAVYLYTCTAGTGSCVTTPSATLSVCCGFSGIYVGSKVAFSPDGSVLAVTVPNWSAVGILLYRCFVGGTCGSGSQGLGGTLVSAFAAISGYYGAIAVTQIGGAITVVGGNTGGNAAYTFACSFSSCTSAATLTASGSFGSAVAVSGDGSTIVVGAPGYGTGGKGATFVYTRCGAGTCSGR